MWSLINSKETNKLVVRLIINACVYCIVFVFMYWLNWWNIESWMKRDLAKKYITKKYSICDEFWNRDWRLYDMSFRFVQILYIFYREIWTFLKSCLSLAYFYSENKLETAYNLFKKYRYIFSTFSFKSWLCDFKIICLVSFKIK